MSASASIETTKQDQTEEPKGKPKRKDPRKFKGNKVEYKPKAFIPLIGLSTSSVPNRYHEFSHDEFGLTGMMVSLVPFVKEIDDSRFNSSMETDVITEILIRLGHMIVAKKMSYALDRDSASIYSSDLKTLLKSILFCPEPIKRIADGYGCLTLDGANFRPHGTAFHAFSHFIKATYIEGQNGLNGPFDADDLIVNMLFPSWDRFVLEHYTRIYKTWAKNTPVRLNVMIGNTNLIMRPPEVFGTYNGLRGLLGNLNLEIPERIARVLNILAVAETVVGLAPTEPQVGLMIQNGLHLVRMQSIIQKNLMAHYNADIEPKVSAHLKTLFICEDSLQSMDQQGQPWQLMDSPYPERGVHPFNLGQSFAEVGYMLDHRVYYEFDAEQMQSFSDTTREAARSKYLRENRIT